jgi:hypothetical protein
MYTVKPSLTVLISSSAGNAPRLEVNNPAHIAQFRLGQCNAAAFWGWGNSIVDLPITIVRYYTDRNLMIVKSILNEYPSNVVGTTLLSSKVEDRLQ